MAISVPRFNIEATPAGETKEEQQIYEEKVPEVASPSPATPAADAPAYASASPPSAPPASAQHQQQEDDMDESERLARQLMAEEEAAFYERLEREQAAAIERMRADDLAASGEVGADLQFALRIAASDPDAEAVASEDEVDPDDMTYDQLLDLGERLGNVAQERWRVEGREAVQAIPVIEFKAGGAETRTKDTKCLVCQYDFEDGEELKLPLRARVP